MKVISESPQETPEYLYKKTTFNDNLQSQLKLREVTNSA